MLSKRRVAVLLSGTVLGASLLAAAPAFADDAQLQQQINSLQAQLQQLQDQMAASRGLPAGLYNEAPAPGGPLAFKAPGFQSGITVSFAGSFIEAATAWRQHNEASSGASDPSFGSLPLQNSPNWAENEWRASAQQSRLAVKFSGDIDPSQHLQAYYEMDFLGAGVTANSRESNSYNLRVRQAFLSYDNYAAHFHMMAGQGWSLLTQDRVGMLPLYENTPLTIDAQYVAGFNWARQPQIRFVEDLNQVAWFGLSIESPQAAIGGHAPAAGTVISGSPYPFINAGQPCSASGLLDAATYCSNDVAPDFVEKVALDPGWGHYELFGLQRWMSDDIAPFPGGTAAAPSLPLAWSQRVTFGWDVGGSFLVPAIPKYLDLQGSVMYGDGGGRYGSSQLADVTYGPNGELRALPYFGAMVGAVGHPLEGLDIYAYAGHEQVQGQYFGSGTDGYGNPLEPETGCALAGVPGAGGATGTSFGSFATNFNSAFGTCTADVKSADELTVGFWDDAYKGPIGRVVWGIEYEYVRDTLFAGPSGAITATSEPNVGLHPDNNIVMTSIRYYPF
jgi:hypothetical protein